MAILLQKSKVIKVAGMSLAMLLAACSSDQSYKREVNGNEAYLDTPPLKALNIPAGMILPLQNGEYDIPPTISKGLVGKELDIRPPSQALTLLSGSRTENSAKSSKLLLENTPENSNLWSQINHFLLKKGYKVSQRDDANQTLTTDWIEWQRADENVPYQTRHRISIALQSYQIELSVVNEGLRQAGQQITDPIEIQRYNALMLNQLIEGVNQQRERISDNTTARNFGPLDVQSGGDTSGLPQIIVRAPYNIVWDRLPAALEKVGMKVGSGSRSTGSVTVNYKGLSTSDWKSMGVNEPSISEGDYKLQVGDLNNRSSLQFISDKGKPLTQVQNDELVAVLTAAFSQTAGL
ncbi:outer membrane protein assembly factor BamC [Photorhabdus cinerea]|uniref:Outer membrane protein assembly factor BamC n=1 Tax=Photorhabdus cinerea TaxID=471575 RepID=A0A7X5TGZ0_9GAMM|nr:outer membrane protein assembly factor BamC [Photorhabdus cinerea]NHB91352.1 outer membrane protein assembly factor BamC [Photorhabdus cinerea]